MFKPLSWFVPSWQCYFRRHWKFRGGGHLEVLCQLWGELPCSTTYSVHEVRLCLTYNNSLKLWAETTKTAIRNLISYSAVSLR